MLSLRILTQIPWNFWKLKIRLSSTYVNKINTETKLSAIVNRYSTSWRNLDINYDECTIFILTHVDWCLSNSNNHEKPLIHYNYTFCATLSCAKKAFNSSPLNSIIVCSVFPFGLLVSNLRIKIGFLKPDILSDARTIWKQTNQSSGIKMPRNILLAWTNRNLWATRRRWMPMPGPPYFQRCNKCQPAYQRSNQLSQQPPSELQ